MNTVVEYCLYGEEDAQALEKCRQKVSELEHILSATWQGSDLERLATAQELLFRFRRTPFRCWSRQ